MVPGGQLQTPPSQVEMTAVVSLQLAAQKRTAPSGASAAQVAPVPLQVVTPVAGSQAQPGLSEGGQIGGSHRTVGPGSAGQVQLPFTQTGAIAVVVVQLVETPQAIFPGGPQPASAPGPPPPSCCWAHPSRHT